MSESFFYWGGGETFFAVVGTSVVLSAESAAFCRGCMFELPPLDAFGVRAVDAVAAPLGLVSGLVSKEGIRGGGGCGFVEMEAGDNHLAF